MWTALRDQLAAVLHTFRTSKGRSFLTLLGIIIGAGSVVLLSGLLSGGREALMQAEQFISDADVIEVEPKEPPPAQRGHPRRELDQADEQALDGAAALGGARTE